MCLNVKVVFKRVSFRESSPQRTSEIKRTSECFLERISANFFYYDSRIGAEKQRRRSAQKITERHTDTSAQIENQHHRYNNAQDGPLAVIQKTLRHHFWFHIRSENLRQDRRLFFCRQSLGFSSFLFR